MQTQKAYVNLVIIHVTHVQLAKISAIHVFNHPLLPIQLNQKARVIQLALMVISSKYLKKLVKNVLTVAKHVFHKINVLLAKQVLISMKANV